MKEWRDRAEKNAPSRPQKCTKGRGQLPIWVTTPWGICRTNFENRGKTPSAFCSTKKDWRDRPHRNAPGRPQKCNKGRDSLQVVTTTWGTSRMNFENLRKTLFYFALKSRNHVTDPTETLPVDHKSVPKVVDSYPFGWPPLEILPGWISKIWERHFFILL